MDGWKDGWIDGLMDVAVQASVAMECSSESTRDLVAAVLQFLLACEGRNVRSLFLQLSVSRVGQ